MSTKIEEIEQLKKELDARIREILKQNVHGHQLNDILGLSDEEDELQPDSLDKSLGNLDPSCQDR